MGHSRQRRIEEIVVHEVALFAALLVVALVQTALLPRPFDVSLNLILLLAVCHGLIAGATSAARWAFYGGLALDLCAMTFAGMHALALLTGVIVSTVLVSRLSRENWLVPILGVAIGAFLYHAVYALLLTLLVAPVDFEGYALAALLPDALIALIPALPLYLVFRWNEDRVRRRVPVDVY
jgi:rod shape-determining protein MreD